jgi:hypothetical protein
LWYISYTEWCSTVYIIIGSKSSVNTNNWPGSLMSEFIWFVHGWDFYSEICSCILIKLYACRILFCIWIILVLDNLFAFTYKQNTTQKTKDQARQPPLKQSGVNSGRITVPIAKVVSTISVPSVARWTWYNTDQESNLQTLVMIDTDTSNPTTMQSRSRRTRHTTE